MRDRIRVQFIALLLAVIILFFGAIAVDLAFFDQVASLYRLETKVAQVFLGWTRLVGQSSAYILSGETVEQAYRTWKTEYDSYSMTWKRDLAELEKTAGFDPMLAGQITWVRDSLNLGVRQLDLMNADLGAFVSDLRLHQPEILSRNTMSSLSDRQDSSAILSSGDEFYLNKVRYSSHLLADLMAPAIGTAQTRFQNQIADRIRTINDQSAGVRLILICLVLVVLVLFLLRIVKLNLDLMAMVKVRTSELEVARSQLEARVLDRTKELTAANTLLTEEIRERTLAETHILRLNRMYATLSNVNQSIVWIHDADRLFQDICRITVEYGQFQRAWIGLIRLETGRVEVRASFGGSGDPQEAINVDLSDNNQDDEPVGLAIRTGECKVANTLLGGTWESPWRKQAFESGYRSAAFFPLFAYGTVTGVMGVYSNEEEFFHEDDVRLVSEMAKDISFALEYLESEKKRVAAEESLQLLNAELENRVHERTVELQERTRELEDMNSELDRMNQLFVGRELRMVELKNRIAELEKS